jgi:3-oxoacyl-[acyl-carrier-protein] synthase II
VTRAVITGVGVVSGFGAGTRALLDGLAEGRSAVGPIRSFDARTLPTRVAVEVPEDAFRALHAIFPSRDRKAVLGAAAAAEAWRSAGCGPGEQDATAVLALGLEQALLEDFAPVFHGGRIDWGAEPRAALPSPRFRAPIPGAAAAVVDRLGLTGPVIANVSACAAGTLAVAHAAALLERGEAEVVLAGGLDSMVNPLGIGGMSRLGAPSPRNDPDACRPFDRRRDGLVIGEGAALFVLEREERARARGARPLAAVLGWGSTQDGHRVTAPLADGSAAAAAITRALARARLAPTAVGHVSAHGTGTPLNDPAEARAIRLALGAHGGRVPVSSIKGAVGHLMAASGAIEIAACLLPFQRDLLPPTAHHREPDPECALDVVGEEPRRGQVEVILKNSFGFGGQNASLLLGRCA